MAKKPEATNFDKLLEELNGAKKALSLIHI